MDRLLSQSLSAPVPTLSHDFDRRVLRHVQRRRLSGPSLFTLSCFAAFALVVSVWTMRQTGIEWAPIAVALMAPVVIVATIFRRESA